MVVVVLSVLFQLILSSMSGSSIQDEIGTLS